MSNIQQAIHQECEGRKREGAGRLMFWSGVIGAPL